MPMKEAKPNLLSKLSGLFKKKNYASSVLLMNQFVKFKFTDFNSYLSAYGKISSLAKSIDIITKYCQMADFSLYQDDEPIDTIPEDIKKVLNKPNPWMTRKELNAFLIADLLLCGNGFTSLNFANFNGQKPREFYRLYPQYIKIEPHKTDKISGYQYGYGTNAGNFYQPEEIIHLKYSANPKDEYFGLGIIEANEGLFEHAIDLNVIRENFLDNGAIPSSIISIPEKINKIERDKMQFDFESKYSGRDNAGKIMVLGGGAKMERISLTPEEIKVLDDHILTHREIFMLFGIPPFLRNLSADDNPKYDNIFQQEITFRQTVIAPMLKTLDELYTAVVKLWYPQYEFRHDDVTDRVSPENIERMHRMFLVSPDEARELLGLKKTNQPAMKRRYAPLNLIPIDELAGMSDATLTAPGGKPEKVRLEDIQSAQDDSTADSTTAQDIAKEGAASMAFVPNGRKRDEKSWRGGAGGGWTTGPAHEIWTFKELSDRANVARIQRDFLRLARSSMQRRMSNAVSAYRTFLDDQVERIAEKFLSISKSSSVLMAKASGGILKQIFDEDIESALIIQVGSSFYRSLTDSAYANLGEILTMELVAEESRKLSERVNLLRNTAPRINDTTKEKLKIILDDAIMSNATPSQAAAAIRDGLGMYNSSRPVTIARNELSAAYREGNRQAMQDSQIITHVSVIGCEAEEANSPQYNGQSTCNITDVPIKDMDSLTYHVNHTGTEVPSKFGVINEI